MQQSFSSLCLYIYRKAPKTQYLISYISLIPITLSSSCFDLDHFSFLHSFPPVPEGGSHYLQQGKRTSSNSWFRSVTTPVPASYSLHLTNELPINSGLVNTSLCDYTTGFLDEPVLLVILLLLSDEAFCALWTDQLTGLHFLTLVVERCRSSPPSPEDGDHQCHGVPGHREAEASQDGV
jgi:hypothetical protein